jgi:histidinol-phosphate phosphatase family protein
MRKPALFIDRDGTINQDCPYCKDPEDLHVYTDAVDIISKYASKGFLIIIITNQSGVNRGYFNVKELQEFNSALIRKVAQMGGRIDDIFYCPHTPEEKCECRKPETGLIKQATEKYEIDMENSVMVGDRDDMDGELARRLGINFILLRH